jgi:proteic killer suppression protein
MIKTFLHKGLEHFFRTGSRRGIAPAHAARLRLQLARLDSAEVPQDMNMPGWRLHPLRGTLREHWAIWVDKNWRLTFRFEGTDVVLVNYQDYH